MMGRVESWRARGLRLLVEGVRGIVTEKKVGVLLVLEEVFRTVAEVRLRKSHYSWMLIELPVG